MVVRAQSLVSAAALMWTLIRMWFMAVALFALLAGAMVALAPRAEAQACSFMGGATSAHYDTAAHRVDIGIGVPQGCRDDAEPRVRVWRGLTTPVDRTGAPWASQLLVGDAAWWFTPDLGYYYAITLDLRNNAPDTPAAYTGAVAFPDLDVEVAHQAQVMPSQSQLDLFSRFALATYGAFFGLFGLSYAIGETLATIRRSW